MNTTTSPVDRSTLRRWVLWIVLSVIGLAIGMVVGLQILWTAGESVEAAIGQIGVLTLAGAIIGASVGLGLGLGQWAVMRSLIARAWRWPLMSGGCGLVAGAALVGLVALLSGAPEDAPPLLMAAIFILIGASIGLGQWLLLRGVADHPARAIIGTALGVGLGLMAMFGLGGEGREWVSLTAGALIAAVATGWGIASSAIRQNVRR